MTLLLATAGLTAFYGDFQALFGIDLAVDEGEAVAVIGANGAGKSTLLRTICGLLPAATDRIRYRGGNIGSLPPADIVARGIALVPEGRKLFPSLSVEENLLMGQQCGRKGPWHLDRVYTLFPILRERRRQPSTSLSGGQQQMAAIGRALMTNPELLAVRRNQSGPRTDRHSRRIRRLAGHSSGGHDACHRRARHQPRAWPC